MSFWKCLTYKTEAGNRSNIASTRKYHNFMLQFLVAYAVVHQIFGFCVRRLAGVGSPLRLPLNSWCFQPLLLRNSRRSNTDISATSPSKHGVIISDGSYNLCTVSSDSAHSFIQHPTRNWRAAARCANNCSQTFQTLEGNRMLGDIGVEDDPPRFSRMRTDHHLDDIQCWAKVATIKQGFIKEI